MKNPKVSIIIPVYNGSNYLKEAIDSALAQTYKNIEIIVVNDGSNDDGATEEIAKSYGNKIRYFKKENGGVATALNLGIKKMTDEYFSWLSHDDLYYPEKIERQINEITKADKKTIVISDWVVIDSKGRLIRKNIIDERLEISPISFLAFDRKTWLNACAMLIPKTLFEKYGYFNEGLKTTQDYDILHRFIKNGVGFKILHQPLICSRSHSGQGSIITPDALKNSDQMHKKIIKDLSSSDLDKYYGNNYDNYISVYDSFFSNGYKRAPAYLLNVAIKNFISNDKTDFAINIMKQKLIGENVNSNEIDFDKYVNKISNKSNKNRIMFCSGHWLTGGMERVMSNLFGELHEKYDIYLLTPFDGRDSCIALPDYVTHIKVSDSLFFDYFDTTILSYALLFNVDVVIGFMNMFEKQLDFYELCDETNIKTIASSHENYLYPYKSASYYRIVQKRLRALKNVDAALWPTNFSVALYDQYNDNGYVLANPNTFEVQNNSIGRNDQKIILCVGRFNDYIKRVDRMLRCFALVLKKEPSAKLILVGKYNKNIPIKPGENISINDLIKELRIPDDSVDFVGEVDNVGDYYSKASLLLLTSDNEGFGMVVNEAACFGVPSVCNDIPGIEDLVIDGENGFITKQDDIEAMAIRVCMILSDKGLRIKLGNNAKELVKRFDKKTIGDKWEYLIDSILEEKPGEALNLRLNKKLSYTISDYQKFCKVLAGELNNVFASTTAECLSQYQLQPFSRRLLQYPKRLVLSIRQEGTTRTFKKIAKKVIKKLNKK